MNMINEALLNLFRHPGTGLHLFIVVAKGRRSKPATLTSSMIVVSILSSSDTSLSGYIQV